jgi:hypothetical protein
LHVRPPAGGDEEMRALDPLLPVALLQNHGDAPRGFFGLSDLRSVADHDAVGFEPVAQLPDEFRIVLWQDLRRFEHGDLRS